MGNKHIDGGEKYMRQLIKNLTIIFMVIFVTATVWSGTTGKIAGIVTDNKTGVPLPGANVIIVGTNIGAATDNDGQFTILQVPPGTYDVEVSVIGYSRIIKTGVEVIIDQTARVDFALDIQVIEGEVVSVVAERRVIKPDVATSVVAITAEETQALPVSNVSNLVGLQAGIQGGLEIRGGGSDEALFLMDGVTLRDPRNNKPISGIALSAIQELSVERGGFNAEYGQVRSGIVNVVTREGSKTDYYGNLELKYSPYTPKHFGISPFDPMSGFLRPFYDDAVCWTGTAYGEPYTDVNGNGQWDSGEDFTDYNGDGVRSYWDKYKQNQYLDFEGWNAVSQKLMTDADPTNDLSPLAAQRVFMWQTRKQPEYDPDYDVDAGFGGPVPIISEKFGNLRFFTTYRRHREMLLVPLTRDDYVDYDWSLKVSADLSSNMKLMISGLVGKQYTMQQNWSYYYLRYPNEIAGQMGEDLGILFGTGEYSLADIGHKSLAAKLTHALSSKTYYEISYERFSRDYYTRPPDFRDTTKYEIVPGYKVDEAPFGYDFEYRTGIFGKMVFGGFTCKRRDNTLATANILKTDLVSQVNFNNLVKAGLEFIYNDIDFDYGLMQNYTNEKWGDHIQFKARPIRSALYVQDKLETRELVVNLGLRLDYSNSNTDWWDVDPYDEDFFTSNYSEDQAYPMQKSKPQWQFSPRLGIAHPITANSKFFFNYGHFKQMPSYETMFRIGRTSDRILKTYGDPNLILAKTISYELGYDHLLFNSLLFQIAAFYHDIFDQQNNTQYVSVGGISYTRSTSNSYEDIRGLEISLRKSKGRWWTFFGNYTYQVSTLGHFGREEMYQDPSRQKEYDEATINLYQERPIPRPYARFNLALHIPEDFGPALKGIYPLGGYKANLLVDWRSGEWVTWNPKQYAAVEFNVQSTDNFNAVLRLSKVFNLHNLSVLVYMDVDNLTNYKQMSRANFGGKPSDREFYYQSLHLPKSSAYDNIPGNDRVGAYRKKGVAFQPMELRGSLDSPGEPGVIYYYQETKDYWEYVDKTWQPVDKPRIDQILRDKAYIDMPNLDSFTFLNPRQFFYGIRVSYDFR